MDTRELLRNFVTITNRALIDAQDLLNRFASINAIIDELVNPRSADPPPQAEPPPQHTSSPTPEDLATRSIQNALDDAIAILRAGGYDSEAARTWLLWGEWRRPRQRSRLLREARRSLFSVREAHPLSDPILTCLIVARAGGLGPWEQFWEVRGQEH